MMALRKTPPADPRAIRAGLRLQKLVGWKYSGNVTRAANAMKCSYWTLYRVTRGQSAPTVDFLSMAARHFNVTVDSLLADDPPRKKNA